MTISVEHSRVSVPSSMQCIRLAADPEFTGHSTGHDSGPYP